MEFEGQYLTYEDYRALGGTLDQTPFNLLEFEARRKIDIKTFNRLKEVDDIPQEVKLCEYALINSIENYVDSISNANSTGSIASENTDGYSITYLTYDKVGQIVQSKESEMDDIIKTYLLGVIVDGEHLMYCGVE